MSKLQQHTIWEISDSDSEGGAERKRVFQGGSSAEDASAPPPADERRRPSPTRKRRSKEEIEADKAKARERREAREESRAARERQRQRKREEIEKRKEAARHLSSFKPENYIKRLTVCIDSALLQQEGSDILLGTLSSFEWRYSIQQQTLPNSITWTKDLPEPTADGTRTVPEDQLLQVLSPSEFLEKAISVKKVIDSEVEEPEAGLFESGHNPDPVQVVTMLVTESQPDYRKHAYALGETNQSKYGGQNMDLEEVLVYLQLHRNVSVLFVDGWQEVTDHVCAVTKSLSKRPYKLLTAQPDLPFCVDGPWASGVRVEKDGSGLRQVWTKQIQQLNRVSQATASCVTAAYPSPQLLLQAYEALSSEEDKQNLLADLIVRAEGRERRVGPDISTRIYRCLTAENPDLVLDQT
ncbi:probable crossover junction endonuclease EME2 [Syngnathoides biaculeatus]|uniref:probable crossover junction endonuclease EME2 n=1 Tax=Syngnathoides biaculeatus TaxID=300417 RepID=UPI002ADD9009|nr:probable crossover junction endonuclease EME2 [Syngnathoides biaculeatus]